MAGQKDNSDLASKVAIRRWLIDQLGGLENLSVLELYAGLGQMFDECFDGCNRHLGIEKRRVQRPNWITGDNRKLLPSHVNDGWDIYDGDAYDNPWVILSDVCRMRGPGCFGLLATCGIGRGLKNGKTNGFIRQVTGTDGLSDTRLLFRWYDDIIQMIFSRWISHGCQVVKCKRVQNVNNPAVWYYAIIVKKL